MSLIQPAFKGTLLLLQNRTRRDPDSYREEFKAQLEHFDALTKTIASNPQQMANAQYIAVMNYVCHVAHCYPKECKHIADILLRILSTTKGSLDPQTRSAFVKNLMMLRAKDLVSPEATLPVLFELLQLRDKPLRKAILSHIVGDVRRANLPGTKNGASINKKAQNFLFKVMEEDDPVQARCAMMVMIDLYRRNVWCDERTVQVMSTACFSKHTAILRTALRFFLMQMPKISSIDDEEDDEAADPGRVISKMKQKLKIVKKTKYRERVLDRRMKQTLKKYNKELQQEEAVAKQHVDPIRLLRDPHLFAEQLLAKLQKTTERFEIRILFLNVLARVVSEHEVVILPLYSFLERYTEPSQLHSTQLLALSAVCVHRCIPPDAIEPLVKAIANHFVSDRSSPDAITIGINTIREICKRQPLAMTTPLLADLAEYKNQRGDKGVMMAARSLIQLYRDIQPDMLPVKLRGSKSGPTAPKETLRFGASTVYHDIPGLELLMPDGADEEEQNLDGVASGSDDGSQIHISDSDDDSDDSGSWEVVSDSDASFSESEDEGFTNVDDDACPQLVPAKVSAAVASVAKRPRAVEVADDDIWVDDEETQSTEKPTPAPAAKKRRVEEESSDEDDDSDELEEDDEEYEEDDEEGDDDEDEESDDEDEDGEWIAVSHSSSDESEEEVPNAPTATVAHAPGVNEEEWFVDADARSARSVASKSSSAPAKSLTSTSGSKVSIAATRFLTDEDFEKIRKLQQQGGDHRSLRGKVKDQLARQQKRQDLIHGVSADLQAHDIETFTERKREHDKEEKIATAQELRAAKSKFEVRKKKKSKLNSTHTEHAKRGKLFQMTKRSQRVADKLKRSVEDKGDRKKEMKKKDIKFRIKRGWKA